MARKEFHFDFNEDADPVEELHRLRVASGKHFKTMEAFLEHIRSAPTGAEFLAKCEAERRVRKAKATTSRKVKANAKTIAPRRKIAKRLAHA